MRVQLRAVMDKVAEYGIACQQAKALSKVPQEFMEFSAKAEAAAEITQSLLGMVSAVEDRKKLRQYIDSRIRATYENMYLRLDPDKGEEE